MIARHVNQSRRNRDGHVCHFFQTQELHDTEIRQETLRVAQRLKLLPTTEAQDQKALKALLDAAAAGGAEAARAAWRKEQVVRFRIQRKRALMHRLSLLEDQLDDLEGL